MQSITDLQTRNLVRGLVNAEPDSGVARKTMERIRRRCSRRDAYPVSNFLSRHHRTPQHILSKAFPRSLNDVENAHSWNEPALVFDLAMQRVRFEEQTNLMLEAIRLLKNLNVSILCNNFDSAVSLFEQIVQDYGISLFILNKANSLRNSDIPDGHKKTLHKKVISPFLTPRRNVLAAAFEDSIDLERDYLRVRRSFNSLITENRLKTFDRIILSDCLTPLSLAFSSLAQRIQAYGRWGVIDSLANIDRCSRAAEYLGRPEDAAIFRNAVPPVLWDAWRNAFAEAEIGTLAEVIGSDSQFFDYALFAHMPAWSEYDNFYRYRLQVEDAMGERLDAKFPIAQRASRFSRPCSDVPSLLASASRERVLDSIDPKNSGAFHRTISLIASIQERTIEVRSGVELSELLDQTINVAALISKHELELFLPARPHDPLYQLLRSVLLYDHEESTVTQHGLRRALQRLVIEQFQGNLVKLLEHIDTPNGHVSRYLYDLLSESFLTELYDLFEEADDVNSAQTSILEWRAVHYADEDAATRAKSSLLSQLLRKVRGAINETRIYVDPLRFLSWLQDAHTTDLRALSVDAENILADRDRTINLRDTVRVKVQPRAQLMKVLDACYYEFCTNILFGITSYVGRRIRHGTLHGHLVLEHQEDISKAISDFEGIAPRFAAHLNSWLKAFNIDVHWMADEQFHVKSKEKPHGLINATLDEPDKAPTASAMLDEVARQMRDKPQITYSLFVIPEYCWRVFEVDLKRTRDALENLRRDYLLDPDKRWSLDTEINRRCSERSRELNSILQRKFDVVFSWLTRPTNASPSTNIDLLFQVVYEEVSKRYPTFRPTIKQINTEDKELIGHRFHYFYDALFILVDNIAKHGAQEGTLTLAVDSTEYETAVEWKVYVTSQFVSGRESRSRERIDAAMRSEVGDPVTTNVNSGIRKLRKLVDEVDEIQALSHVCTRTTVTIRLDMRLHKN